MLMGILPNVHLAARTASDESKPLLWSAAESASRAAELVRQLMTYAGRNRPSTRSVVDLGSVVQRAVEFCRTTFDKRITIEGRYAPLARARVDAAQIEQSLLNLLINARDALEEARAEAPRIDVIVEAVRARGEEPGEGEKEYVRIRVGDNGAGMAPRRRRASTNRSSPRRRSARGPVSGSRRPARSCASTVASSRARRRPVEAPRSRCTFRPSRRRCSSRPYRPVSPPARGSETVLVVDDEPSIRRVVKLMLTDGGFRTLLAASGAEAIALLSDPAVAAEVALLLLDVSMPGMPALALRRRLRDFVPRAKVLYFTGYAFEADDPEDAVLEKPVTEKELLRKIREVLDGSARA